MTTRYFILAVFVPTGDVGKVGKLIHRNYDFSVTQRKHQIIPLALVNDQCIADTVGNGQPSADTTARDRLESVATVVPPPSRSPNPFDPSKAPNCQNWLQGYVQRLVEEGIVPSSASLVVQNAPKLL
ncbi:hypothetical protein BJX76DRAFT_350806 [Aspergillus varians]